MKQNFRHSVTSLVGLTFIVCQLAYAADDLPRKADATALAIKTFPYTHKKSAIANALDFDRLSEHSALKIKGKAVGMELDENVGVEASYTGLSMGEVKYIRGLDDFQASDQGSLGRLVDLKLALDLPIATTKGYFARLYSKVGMYVWDLNALYQNAKNDIYTLEGNTSTVWGIGAAFGYEGLTYGVELENINLNGFVAGEELTRVLFNIGSKF